MIRPLIATTTGDRLTAPLAISILNWGVRVEVGVTPLVIRVDGKVVINRTQYPTTVCVGARHNNVGDINAIVGDTGVKKKKKKKLGEMLGRARTNVDTKCPGGVDVRVAGEAEASMKHGDHVHRERTHCMSLYYECLYTLFHWNPTSHSWSTAVKDPSASIVSQDCQLRDDARYPLPAVNNFAFSRRSFRPSWSLPHTKKSPRFAALEPSSMQQRRLSRRDHDLAGGFHACRSLFVSPVSHLSHTSSPVHHVRSCLLHSCFRAPQS